MSDRENDRRRDDEIDNSFRGVGISFPRTISVGVILVALFQASSLIWNASKYSAGVDKLSEQINVTNSEIQKLKAEIYTRSEASIQSEYFKRELEIHRKNMERMESDIRELQNARRNGQ